jgi:hypothetical protein
MEPALIILLLLVAAEDPNFATPECRNVAQDSVAE